MTTKKKQTSTFAKLFRRVEEWGITILGLAALANSMIEVFLRYFIPTAVPDWSTEVTLYFVTGAVFLAGARLVDEGGHVQADLIYASLGARMKAYLGLLFSIVGFLLCGVFSFFGIEVVLVALELEEKSDSSLQLSMAVYYFMFVVAFLLCTTHYARRVARQFKVGNVDLNQGYHDL